MDFEFVGTTTVSVKLDPGEYVGMDYPGVVMDIEMLLMGIAPGVNFFPDDVCFAATHIVSQGQTDAR